MIRKITQTIIAVVIAIFATSTAWAMEVTYNIILPDNNKLEHGTVHAEISYNDVTQAAEGQYVNIKYEPNGNYEAYNWSVTTSGKSVELDWSERTACSFTMPAGDVTVNFEEREWHYRVETGKTPDAISITSDKDAYLPNATVTLTVTPHTNIILDNLMAYYNNNPYLNKKGKWNPLDDPYNVEVALTKVSETQYTFIMPEHDVMLASFYHYKGAYAINLSNGLEDFVNDIFVIQNNKDEIPATAANKGDVIIVNTNGRFKDLKITTADNKEINVTNDYRTYKFEMPDGAVTISGTPLYSLSLYPYENGKATTLSVDGKELTPEETGEYFLPANTTVTVTAVPTGNNVASVSIHYPESGEKIECPQKTGEDNTYIFTTRDEGLNLEVIFGASKKLTFEANGGSGTQKEITIAEYGRVELPKCTFKAPDNMSFAGWYSETENKIFSPGYIVYVSGDLEFTAEWLPTDNNNGFGVITRGSGDEERKTAIFDDSKPKVEISSETKVNNVQFTRQFNFETMSTIVFPFDYSSHLPFVLYEFASVRYDKQKGKWVATISPVDEIKANTPYLIKTYQNEPLIIDGGNDGITLTPTKQAEYSVKGGDWTFHATYGAKKWNDENLTTPTYGFAGVDDGGIKAGDFVRVAAGASIAPMRCYLTYEGSDERFTKSAAELPDVIEVVIVDKDETIDTPDEIVTPVAKTEAQSEAKVWSFDRTIYIEAQPDTEYTIIDLGGRKLKTGVTQSTREQITLARSTNGIVIVVINGKAFKIGY